MNLYLLRPKDPEDRAFHGYDVFCGFVVAAEDEASARAEVPRCADECRHDYRDDGAVCVWRDPAKTTCELIGTAAPDCPAGVLMEDFNAG